MLLDFEMSLDKLILRVDGGMSASNWTMQNLSNIIQAPVDRPKFLETTALGAAWLAGLKAGVYPKMDDFSEQWDLDIRFKPKIQKYIASDLYKGWKRAVSCTL